MVNVNRTDSLELKDRIRLVLEERQIKQKELASAIKVSESYISNILKGKRRNISSALAMLIEQNFGYSAVWILSGEGEPYVTQTSIPDLSPTKKRLIAEIERMSEPELDAVKVFIDSLEGYKKAFGLDKN